MHVYTYMCMHASNLCLGQSQQALVTYPSLATCWMDSISPCAIPYFMAININAIAIGSISLSTSDNHIFCLPPSLPISPPSSPPYVLSLPSLYPPISLPSPLSSPTPFSDQGDCVLKVTGQNSFLHGENELRHFSYVVDCLIRKQDIQLTLVSRLSPDIDRLWDIEDVRTHV